MEELAADWEVGDVGEWLEAQGLGKYRPLFEAHGIDGQTLVFHVTTQDLRDELHVAHLLERKKLWNAIEKLRHKTLNTTNPPQPHWIPDSTFSDSPYSYHSPPCRTAWQAPSAKSDCSPPYSTSKNVISSDTTLTPPLKHKTPASTGYQIKAHVSDHPLRKEAPSAIADLVSAAQRPISTIQHRTAQGDISPPSNPLEIDTVGTVAPVPHQAWLDDVSPTEEEAKDKLVNAGATRGEPGLRNAQSPNSNPARSPPTEDLKGNRRRSSIKWVDTERGEEPSFRKSRAMSVSELREYIDNPSRRNSFAPLLARKFSVATAATQINRVNQIEQAKIQAHLDELNEYCRWMQDEFLPRKKSLIASRTSAQDFAAACNTQLMMSKARNKFLELINKDSTAEVEEQAKKQLPWWKEKQLKAQKKKGRRRQDSFPKIVAEKIDYRLLLAEQEDQQRVVDASDKLYKMLVQRFENIQELQRRNLSIICRGGTPLPVPELTEVELQQLEEAAVNDDESPTVAKVRPSTSRLTRCPTDPVTTKERPSSAPLKRVPYTEGPAQRLARQRREQQQQQHREHKEGEEEEEEEEVPPSPPPPAS